VNSEHSGPSREEVARVEVGHTAVTHGVARVLVVCFLVMVAALPIVDLAGLRASDEPSPWAELGRGLGIETVPFSQDKGTVPFFRGRVVPANRAVLASFSAFETALEDRSSVGRLLRPPVQAVLSGGLGAGNERVYIGRDGWLFYREDVESLTGRAFLDPGQLARRVAAAPEFEAPPAPDPRPAIRQFARDLSARGITLVLVPTPVKPTVHPGHLAPAAERAAAPVQNPSFGNLVDEVRREGILVFDPAPGLVLARQTTGAAQYLATDTHWRPEAMQREAEALAAFVREHVALPDHPAAGYTTEPREARHAGDTRLMLDLPMGHALYPPETVSLRFVVGPDGLPWRPLRGADVLVLGDSFSNIYSVPGMGWGEAAGFVEQLSLALDRPVDRIVQNDQGARATRELLVRDLRTDPDRLASTRVVIWQFATRELSGGDWSVLPLP
jgi:hypothetical protein